MLRRFVVSATALAVALASFSFTSSVAALAADDAAALMAKHRAFVGWQFGDGTFSYLTIEARRTRTVDGADRVVGRWTTVQAGPVFRTSGTGSIPGPADDYGFTGRVFWESDENGFTHPDYSDLRAFIVSRSVLFNEAITQLEGTIVGTKALGSDSYPVVRVTPAYGDPIELYVDPATGAFRRAVIDPQGEYETTYDIDAYSEVLPGKKMISKYSYPQLGITDEFVKVQPLSNVSDDALHPPAQVATWNFANPNAFRVDVKAHAIFVDATVNGVRGRFVVDTGASDIVLDRGFASRAHLATVRQSHAWGFGGETTTMVQRADSVAIGGNTLNNVVVTSIGDAFGQMDGENVDGLLGFPLFAGAVVSLNTGGQTMTITDPQTAAIDKTGYPVTVDLSDGTPNVPMLVDGNVKVHSTLDFGSSGTVLMSPNIVRERHIPFAVSDAAPSAEDTVDNPAAAERYYESHMVIEGIGGVSRKVSCATVQSIDLGPIHYQGTIACLDPDVPNDSIVVGYEFLKQFDYVFDYHDGLVVMRPHSQ